MNVSAGQPITLECWAVADPAPQFYWVTPTGDKVGRVMSLCVCVCVCTCVCVYSVEHQQIKVQVEVMKWRAF